MDSYRHAVPGHGGAARITQWQTNRRGGAHHRSSEARGERTASLASNRSAFPSDSTRAGWAESAARRVGGHRQNQARTSAGKTWLRPGTRLLLQAFADPHDHCRAGVVDRLRERRDVAVGQSVGATERDRHADGTGRRARAHISPTTHREHDVGFAWRRAGTGSRLLDDRGIAQGRGLRRNAALFGSAAGYAYFRFYRAGVSGVGDSLWTGARAARDASPACGFAQGRSFIECEFAREFAREFAPHRIKRSIGSFASGVVVVAAGGRGAIREHPA